MYGTARVSITVLCDLLSSLLPDARGTVQALVRVPLAQLPVTGGGLAVRPPARSGAPTGTAPAPIPTPTHAAVRGVVNNTAATPAIMAGRALPAAAVTTPHGPPAADVPAAHPAVGDDIPVPALDAKWTCKCHEVNPDLIDACLACGAEREWDLFS